MRLIIFCFYLLVTIRAWLWPWQTTSTNSDVKAEPTNSGGDSSSSSSSSDSGFQWGAITSEVGGAIGGVFGSSSASKTSDQSSTSTDATTKEQDSSASATESSSAASSGSSSGGGNGVLGGLFGGLSTRNAYQPYETDCPSDPIVRRAENISSHEADYIKNRQVKTNENLIKFLQSRANLTNFNAEDFVKNSPRNISIGLAFSGGGYRAMLNGAGQILGLDGRFDDANQNGLGGLLQSTTYLSGLSGGNWLVGSLVLNDWVSVADILSSKVDIWKLQDSIFNPNGLNVVATAEYYTSMYEAISAKEDAGYESTITDVWGRALSSQFFVSDDHGENITWSGIRDLESFKSYDMPFPIVIANGRTPGTLILNLNSTVFEISPYELGSWDPSLETMADVKYVGSYVEDGTNSTGKCMVNFDNAGFIMGTSSSLFNAILLRAGDVTLPSAISTVFKKILAAVSSTEVDIADYSPNPYLGSSYGTVSSITQNETLYLVDGGEDGQNVPFYPLIQNSREVDIILAYDNSADTDDNWPNGTSIIQTYQRQFGKQGKGTPFPYVPDVDTFLKTGLTKKPVFFGCDAKNLTSLVEYHHNSNITETDIPLVVLFSNNQLSYGTNTSTFKMSYDREELEGIIQNGFEVSTRNNFTDDSKWATCLGCAIIRRTQERLGDEQSDECKKCFEEYCWTGGEKDAAPTSAVAGFSAELGGPSSTGGSSNGGSRTGGAASATGTSTSSSSKKGEGYNAVSIPSRLLTAMASLLLFVVI